jgi:hypothetical protein
MNRTLTPHVFLGQDADQSRQCAPAARGARKRDGAIGGGRRRLQDGAGGSARECRSTRLRVPVIREKGDVHGRVDHASLGKSLHQVGDCLTSTGEFAAAKPWFERAVAEKEKGDVHGRVDHASLGISRDALHMCLRKAQQ